MQMHYDQHLLPLPCLFFQTLQPNIADSLSCLMPPRLCGTAQPWFPESWAFLNLSDQFQPFQRYYDLNLNCFSQSHVLKLWSPSSCAVPVVCEAFRWWTLLARGEPLKVSFCILSLLASNFFAS